MVRRPDGNVLQRLLEGEQVCCTPSQRTGFLPWDSLLPRPSSHSLLCLSPPKKSQALGRGGGGAHDLHPHPCPLEVGDHSGWEECLYLYLALLPQNHKLIHELAAVYTEAIATSRGTVLRVTNSR